ncbi:hypothetical protein B0T25DRAFT_21769 [Lasiosphaeria hispida]|uniref:Uncharacterized protein n=1 Tax=Lasiosphaeria hispida TaxID=260671 RepID=A0AAJ0HU15_9PEZI|nr:hypothetical protein B0T25DRAFT_21769 [Lasiosphaeria hispida]
MAQCSSATTVPLGSGRRCGMARVLMLQWLASVEGLCSAAQISAKARTTTGIFGVWTLGSAPGFQDASLSIPGPPPLHLPPAVHTTCGKRFLDPCSAPAINWSWFVWGSRPESGRPFGLVKAPRWMPLHDYHAYLPMPAKSCPQCL